MSESLYSQSATVSLDREAAELHIYLSRYIGKATDICPYKWGSAPDPNSGKSLWFLRLPVDSTEEVFALAKDRLLQMGAIIYVNKADFEGVLDLSAIGATVFTPCEGYKRIVEEKKNARRRKTEKKVDLLRAPVKALGLSVATTNVLKRGGIITVGNLVSLSEADIASLPGVGPKTREEIMTTIRGKGLYLKGTVSKNGKIIEKKILPEFFAAVISGRKTFELRKDEDNIKEGDTLVLNEYDGFQYTGRKAVFGVSYVLRHASSYGLMEGYCIIGLKSSK